MDENEYKGLLISDFNVNSFSGYLENDISLPRIISVVAPYGQVAPILTEENLKCWDGDYDFVIVWTQPEKVIETFNKVLSFENFSIDTLLEEVDRYSSMLMRIQNKVKIIFVPTWVLPPYKTFALLDMQSNSGLMNILMRINLRLSENLSLSPNFHILNTPNWINQVGKYAFNAKAWYMAKVPFGNEVLKEAVKSVKSAINGITGHSKKIIILDLDNILWGGSVGEVGWENLLLGGHHHVGEAFVDFQKALKALTRRGIMLAIISKNQESIALEAINNHPEMILRSNDFVGWKINWKEKAKNTIELISELNLGLQSTVFIDDSPVERARVKEALPEVFVPEWPENQMLHKEKLMSLTCFNTPSISSEDQRRTEMYSAQKKRSELELNVSSYYDWLNTLETTVKVEELNKLNLSRISQLLNKTNQMNLATRRLAEDELLKWEQQSNHKLWVIRILDRFGDMGLTGIISLEVNGGRGQIVDFVLSCRVMGRKIEETMLFLGIRYAKLIKLREMWSKYIPTSKNIPCFDFWKEKSGFEYDETQDIFKWKVNKDYMIPECISLVDPK